MSDILLKPTEQQMGQQLDDFNERIGAITAWTQHETGVSIECNNALVGIDVYASGVVRVNINKRDRNRSGISYAVVQEAQPSIFEVSEDSDNIRIRTDLLELRVAKAPLSIAFYTSSGEIINEDYPAFGTSWLGNEVTTYKTPQEGERFIGLGEKNGNLDRRGTACINWNTDKFAYSVEDDPLYLSTPFYMGVHSGLQYGILFDNSYKSVFNFGASNDRFMYFSADDGPMNYYFIYDTSVAGILNGYSWLTGRMPLPPKWSLGLHQCRYSYYPDSEVMAVARTFREKKIPADVVYLDIHYMQDYKVFTFHKERFANPKGMADDLADLGFNLALIVDPGVKREDGYEPYESGKQEDVFVKYPDGEPYAGEVWPGWSHFPDFTSEKGRDWWASKFDSYVDNGVTGFWNDMNEPAAWGQHLPNLIQFDYDGEGATHKKARNVYGHNMARSTYQGTKKLLNGKRPFILTRAGFAGIQRYAAVWTGDNVSSDEHMLGGVRLLNSMGLTGIPFAGYDVGGFAEEANPGLFARWISLGAFSPFFRCHSMVNTRDAEPWAFGEEAEQIARNYINLRYALMPYIYSTFREAAVNGLPVVRSLAIDYTHDQTIYNAQWQHQYLFGHGIMVAPVVSTKDLVKVYLPQDHWYDLYTDQQHEGGQITVADCAVWRLPLYVRGGSILPMQSQVQSLKEAPDTTLRLHIYKGSGASSFKLYEDDGTSYAFEDGDFMERNIVLDSDASSLKFEAPTGNRSSHFTTVKVYFHGFGSVPAVATANGSVQTSTAEHRFVQPITGIDTFYEDIGTELRIADLPSVEVEHHMHAFEISW